MAESKLQMPTGCRVRYARQAAADAAIGRYRPTATATATASKRTRPQRTSSPPSRPASPARARSSVPKQSCAACKHQRRKCTARCVLAPYFPADRPKRFGNAHRLFGVKNILRLLEEAGPENRDDCARSIIYESDARAEHPVRGCEGIVGRLYDEWKREATELDTVRRRLASCRETCRLPQPPCKAPYPPRAALPLATAAHEPMYDDDQAHARKKMMCDNGEAIEDEGYEKMIWYVDDINAREPPCATRT